MSIFRPIVRPLFAACMAAALIPSFATAQSLSSLDRDRGRAMLRAVRTEIERRYYDPAFHGVDLAASAEELDQRIQQATTLADVMAAVAQLPMLLGDSHTFFVPPQRTISVEYGWSMLMVGDSCFVEKVEAQSDAARQGVAPGDRVLSVNGYRPTRENLWQIQYVFHILRPQRGLHVALRSPDGRERELDLEARVHQSFRVMDLTGMDGGFGIADLIRASEMAADEYAPRLINAGDSVLVWKLPTFDVSDDAIREARARMRRRSALVLDLRGNGGGPVETLQDIIGMINREDVAVATQHERTRTVPLTAKGTGDEAFAGKVIVLVDSRSASASEVLARVVQLTGRGTVLGDRTEGAVMRARHRTMGMGAERAVYYGVSVTEADLVMADGGRLEKVGVTPDTIVLPTAQSLAAGEDVVLARALELAGHPLDPAAAGALVRRR
jgi:carboxyl-terminal processing protease